MTDDDELTRREWLLVLFVGTPIFAVLAVVRVLVVERAPASDAVTAAAAVTAFVVLRTLWFLLRAPR